ncbi:hypothetical protein NMG60_11021554 [Bertholletia excelsa]
MPMWVVCIIPHWEQLSCVCRNMCSRSSDNEYPAMDSKIRRTKQRITIKCSCDAGCTIYGQLRNCDDRSCTQVFQSVLLTHYFILGYMYWKFSVKCLLCSYIHLVLSNAPILLGANLFILVNFILNFQLMGSIYWLYPMNAVSLTVFVVLFRIMRTAILALDMRLS